MLQFPHGLCAQVYKSRYFEGDCFLEAEIGVRSSYAWKSIIHGRALLSKGIKRWLAMGTNLWYGVISGFLIIG